MSKPNRDLLVLFDQQLMTPKAIEHEVEMLHELLCNFERLDNLVTTHEVIDLNKYKVIKKPLLLRSVFLQKKELRPFVFLNCVN